MEEITRRALLFDFYGPLLTSKQQDIYDLYFQQDLSLGEIAEIQGVSRQAVYDLLKRTEESLMAYENKLGLVQKYQETKDVLAEIEKEKNRLAVKYSDLKTENLEVLLSKLKNIW